MRLKLSQMQQMRALGVSPVLIHCNEVLFVSYHSAATDQRSRETMNEVRSGAMMTFGAVFGAMYDVYGDR